MDRIKELKKETERLQIEIEANGFTAERCFELTALQSKLNICEDMFCKMVAFRECH